MSTIEKGFPSGNAIGIFVLKSLSQLKNITTNDLKKLYCLPLLSTFEKKLSKLQNFLAWFERAICLKSSVLTSTDPLGK